LQIFKNYGEGNWRLEMDTTGYDYTHGMVAHDFDGNGRAEIIWIHHDDSKVVEFTNIHQYIIGECSIAGDWDADNVGLSYLAYPEGESLPMIGAIHLYLKPWECPLCYDEYYDTWKFVRRSGNYWLFGTYYPRFKASYPLGMEDIKIADVDNDGISEVVPGIFRQFPLGPGTEFPTFYFDNIDRDRATYDTIYIHHGLYMMSYRSAVQDFDIDGMNELVYGGAG